MEFHPSYDLQEQYGAFQALFEALADGIPPEMIPEKGKYRNIQTGILWSWMVEAKAGSKDYLLRWVNTFKRKEDGITVTVPLNTVDVNNRGIVAKTADGRAYLCHQTLEDAPLSARPDDLFADNWTGPDYPAFPVTGTPSTRTYYACIPLSDGPDKVRKALTELLDGLRIRRLALGKKRTKKSALEVMSKYYQTNEHLYSAAIKSAIKSQRDQIINLLMQGIDVDEAFKMALKITSRSES